MADHDDSKQTPPTYQDAQDDIESLAGCIRLELILYLVGGAIAFVIVLILLK